MTRDDAWSLANHWVAAWNAHDLDLIMSHYDDAVELTSPAAAQLLGKPDGKVVGKRVASLSGTPFSPGGCALGRQQRGALLPESKGNANGRVHGAVSE